MMCAFRWLAAGAAPDYRAIARFRKRHLSALGHLFVQALALCQAAGMVSLGRVALDGTKVRANASKRKAMSYARMTEKEKILAAEVSALLAEAERIDKAEDKQFGKDRRGDELPAELARRETRLAKIRAGQGRAGSRGRRGGPARRPNAKARDRGDDDDTTAGKGAGRGAAGHPETQGAAQLHRPGFQDHAHRRRGVPPVLQRPAVVDADHQVIVAADVGTNASDVGTLLPMTEQAVTNTGLIPGQVLADAGYCSTANLDARRRSSPPPAAPSSSSPPAVAAATTTAGRPAGTHPRSRATAKQRMARKLRHQEAASSRLCPPQSHRRTRLRSDVAPCRTPNICCCAGSSRPAGNGYCWPPATTFENCTATSELPD